MSLGSFLLGAALLAVTYGSSAYAAARVSARYGNHLSSAARLVGAIVVFLALVVGVHMVAGLLEILSRWTVAALALAVALASLRIRAAHDRAPEEHAPGGHGVAGALAVAAVAICGAAATWRLTVRASTGADTVGFHLPAVARWIQTGSFWHIDQFAPVWAIGNYPQSGDVLTLSAVLPWRNDAFAQLLNVALLAFAGLVTYALALELRAPRRAALVCAALFCSIPVLMDVGYGGTMPDVFLASTFGAGTLFLLRGFREHARYDLVVAGLGLGLAFGAKWNGVYVAAIAILVWASAWLIVRRPFAPLLRRGALLAGLVALAGGFWMLRNWLLASNPVIPVKVHLLGATVFDSPPDDVRSCAGFRVADYLTSGHVWSHYLLPAYRDWLGAPAALLGAGLVAAVVNSVRERRGALIGVCVCAFLIAIAYTLTPFSALGLKDQPLSAGFQSRYLLPALLLAAAASAAVLGTLRGRSRVVGELVALVAIALGLRRGLHEVPHSSLLLGAFVLAAAVTAATIALGARRGGALRMTAAALAAVLVLGVAYGRQRKFVDDRYRGIAPALDYISQNASPGQHVALAGTPSPSGVLPILPAFGPSFENHVSYPARDVQTILRPYGGEREWAAAIERGGYDLVLASSGGYDPIRCAPDPPGQTADDWARAAGFQRVAGSPPLTLYRAR
jgi:hypothetical protein